MANVRLNQFNTVELLHEAFQTAHVGSQLMFQGVYVPGSISFNNAVVHISGNNNARTVTVSLGLYSLNAGSLSLANSASQSTTIQNAANWMTLATSAAQDITPGNWYFAVVSATSGNANVSLLGNRVVVVAAAAITYAGLFVRGYYSATTTALPTVIATSEMNKEGTSALESNHFYPFILISA